VSDLVRQARLWVEKWRWYERNSLPWTRASIHWEFMRREAFVRWPVHGNVLEALREGRLEIGPHVLLEPGVWITAPGVARVRIGQGTFLNMGVMVAAEQLVEIGEHCLLANGCFVTDSSYRSHGRGFRARGPPSSVTIAGSARTWWSRAASPSANAAWWARIASSPKTSSRSQSWPERPHRRSAR
jgi:hypothetical protein